jgi:integrase
MRYRFTDPATMRAQQDVQDMFVALTLTGGRWSEVTAITWDRVNLEKLEVTLWGTHKGTKRTVPIPRQCAEVLLRRHAERDPGNPLVFPGRDGAQRTAGTRAIAKAFTACGLNRPDLVAREGTATIHSLRHTYASWLRQSGVQLDDVSDMLGHASLQMTRRYAAIKPQEQRAVVKAALDNVGH